MSNVAASVRREREEHPERFCAGDKRCLFRVKHNYGPDTPCPRHPVRAAPAPAPAPETRPSITDRIARFRVTRIMSHVAEKMRSLHELWSAIDLKAGPDEKPEHIVGIRSEEAFCFQHSDFTCDAPIAVQAERMRLALEEPTELHPAESAEGR